MFTCFLLIDQAMTDKIIDMSQLFLFVETQACSTLKKI